MMLVFVRSLFLGMRAGGWGPFFLTHSVVFFFYSRRRLLHECNTKKQVMTLLSNPTDITLLFISKWDASMHHLWHESKATFCFSHSL